jgi:hypothetical protein
MSLTIPDYEGYYDTLENLDPDKFYRKVIDKSLKNAQGLERFALKVIPFSVIKSFALALDPVAKFKMSPQQVVPPNRTRTRIIRSVLDGRKAVYTRRGAACSNNLEGPPWHYGDLVCIDGSVDNTVALQPQDALRWTSADTTKSTRPSFQDYGEFEKFKYTVSSPDRHVNWWYTDHIDISRGSWGLQKAHNDYTYNWHVGPAGARIDADAIDLLKTEAEQYAADLIQEHGKGMLNAALATSRTFNLAREIGELKDLPRSIRQLLGDLSRFSSTERLLSRSVQIKALKSGSRNVRSIPDKWLSYWFGWLPLYKASMSLLSSPEKIARKINFLLRRNGKEQTSRIHRTLLWSESSPSPLFDYEPLTYTYGASSSANHTREVEIRVVINSKFSFPPVDLPKFKRNLFLKKLGLWPRIGDLYELAPWSWLLDWFTGLGNYVELIDTINNDPSLFNYGFITVVIKGKHQTNHTCHTSSWKHQSVSFTYVPPTEIVNTHLHSSVIDYECQIRRSITSIGGVAHTGDVNSLSSWQQSILGSLLLQRGLN